jgi:protein-L-isoaspartate O-methyltransferase
MMGSVLVLAALPGCEDLSRRSVVSESSAPADTAVSKDVAYIPTPQWLVDRMLAVADVSEDDVVYDLGSGDGRLVITAAKRHGARGVGVEIEPELVRTARAKARLAGVSDRVTFRQGDLFETDLHDATVVTLYLRERLNLRLRPKLFRQLDPGDRVVSHRFGMGNWAPDRVVKTGGRTIYRWTIPAQVPDSLLRR